MPHGKADDSQGSCTPPIMVGTDRLGEGESRRMAGPATPKARGTPPDSAIGWDRFTDPSCVQLTL